MASAAPEAPNFSFLPDIVWVNVLSYLNLQDRCHVALTCHALNDAFNHPSLWHTAKIMLLGSPDYWAHFRTILPDRYRDMINRFGGYFQNLSLKIVGYLDHFPPECRRVIQTLSERCRLESLTLDVGVTLTSLDFFQHVPSKTELDPLVNFVANAFRLKTFNLKAWPLYRGVEKIPILDALMGNPKLKNLEKINLFCQTAKYESWATLNASLPSPEYTLSLAQHFSNLRHLGLRSSMLNEDIITALSHPHHAPLERLDILITYTRYQYLGVIPEISSLAWQQLREHSPRLKVELTVLTRMPFVDLAGFLKPEIPVYTLEFMKYSQLGMEDLVSVTEKYSKTLCKFVSLTDSESLDASLKLLVTRCPNLTYLVYHGNINYRTVMELAALRGPDWHTLEVLAKTVEYIDTRPLADLDPDVILIETAPGRVELVEIVKQRILQEEETKAEERFEEMVQTVSKTIGQKWCPVKQGYPE